MINPIQSFTHIYTLERLIKFLVISIGIYLYKEFIFSFIFSTKIDD